MKICWKYTHSQAIQDIDEFVSSLERIWRDLAYTLILTVPIHCIWSIVSNWRNAEFLFQWQWNKLIILDGQMMSKFSSKFHV